MKFLPSTVIDAPSYYVEFFDGKHETDKVVVLRDLKLESDLITMNTSLQNLSKPTHILDLTDNNLTSLPDLRSRKDIHSLLLAKNRICYTDGKLLPAKLKNLILSNNGITTLSQLNGLKYAPKSLENLALRDNQIVHLEGYRNYILTLLPNLLILDFKKVTKEERKLVAESPSIIEEAQGTADANSTITLSVNEIEQNKTLELMQNVVKTMTSERKNELKQKLANATSLDEIERLESLLSGGIE